MSFLPKLIKNGLHGAELRPVDDYSNVSVGFAWSNPMRSQDSDFGGLLHNISGLRPESKKTKTKQREKSKCGRKI